VNAVQNSKVVGKFRLTVPERIYNLPNIACKSAPCIASLVSDQRDVVAYFERKPFYESSAVSRDQIGDGASDTYLYICKYCRWPHRHAEIWFPGTTT